MSSTKKSVFDVDLINGPVFKSLILFSIPIFVSLLFQTLYSTVDTFIVGNVLGDTSLAAVGSSVAIFDLLVGFTNGVGSGLTIVTSRCFGSGDKKLLRKSIATCLTIGFGIAFVVTFFGFISLRPLMHLLRTPSAIFEEAYSYVSVIVFFIVVMFAYNLGSSILRAIGDSIMPFIFLLISSLLNIFLDYYCVATLKMGVRGAAVATVIAQGLSAILCFIYILKKKQFLIPAKEDFKYDPELFKDMLGQGVSMGLMGSIVSLGTLILQYGINDLGEVYIAAHNAARRVYAILMLPFMATSTASVTFAGQNVGAGKIDRIKESLKKMYLFDIIYSLVCFGLSYVFADDVMGFISGSTNPVIISSGAKYCIVASAFYGVLAILLQSRMTLQGLGAKVVPLVSSIIECLGKILFCFVFVPMFKYEAVIWCEPLIWVVMTINLVYSLWNYPLMKNQSQLDCA